MPRSANRFVRVSAPDLLAAPVQQVSAGSEKMWRNEALCGAFGYFGLPSFTAEVQES